MATLDLDNLEGFTGDVLLAARPFTDPWGWAIAGIVLRGDSPEWRQFTLDVEADKPAAAKVRQATAENIFSDMAPQGFRQGKKLSKTEAYKRMVRQVAARDEVKIDILDLRDKKSGIAQILCLSLTFRGQSIVRRRGIEFDLSTPAGRMAFMDHQLWESPPGQDGGAKTAFTVPVFKRGPAGETLLDSEQEPIENDYLPGWNLGDALAQLIVDESKNLSAFVEVQKAAVQGESKPISAGSTGTGFPALSPAGEP